MLKRLSTSGEVEVFKQISPIADRYQATVYRKVRIADVIDIKQLSRGSLGSYALAAHFDFVVADKTEHPQFALEFDGSGHSPSHDYKKDQICRLADLALFRVDLRSTRIQTARLRFLEYLAHLWFLGNRFKEMLVTGTLPADEPFVMSGFLRPNAKNVFDSEFDLVGPSRSKLVRLCKKRNLPGGPLWHLLLAWALLAHDEGSYVSFCSFPLNHTTLFGRAVLGLKTPHLGALAAVPFARHELGQFCAALAIEDLVEEIKLQQSGAGNALRTQHDVLSEITTLKNRGYKTLQGGYSRHDELANAVL
jgi:hypothetical protein